MHTMKSEAKGSSAASAAISRNSDPYGDGSDVALQPDPTAPPHGPSARLGAPLSEAMRQTAAELVAEGTDWMEGHWREARWAGLAAAVGALGGILQHPAGMRGSSNKAFESGACVLGVQMSSTHVW